MEYWTVFVNFFIKLPAKLILHEFNFLLTYHVSFKNVVHDLMSGEAGGVDEELEGEFQPGVHFPSSGFALAFFSTTLKCNEMKRQYIPYHNTTKSA